MQWCLTRGCVLAAASLLALLAFLASGALVLVATSARGERGADVVASAGALAPESGWSDDGTLDRRTVEALTDRAAAVTLPIAGVGCDRTIAGNAVYVDEVLLTNRHLVERSVSVQVGSFVGEPLVTADGRDIRAASVDLGIVRPPSPDLSIDLPFGPAAPLATRDPDPGEAVLLAAWIDGRLHTIVGRVHAYTTGGAHGDGLAMLLEPATEPGFSGGAVLDRRGDVVGILRAVDATTDLAVAVPASDIHEWRRLALRRVEPPTCR